MKLSALAETRDFAPPYWLRPAHVQTVAASIARESDVARRASALVAGARTVDLRSRDGVVLQAAVTEPPRGSASAPTVVIIHGWLGHNAATYVRSAGATLLERGFRVARLNLRDHGGTEHLNPGLFHSARTDEVVDAVAALVGDRGGVLGFSLGGNFALRVSRALGLPALAVCPALDPAATMDAIDSGLKLYRWYFVRKWHRALRAKAAAFPALYDFDSALRLGTVGALTEVFVREHTDYAEVARYLAAYTLTGTALDGTRATIVAALDDPIIPAAGLSELPASIEVVPVPQGGHCGFIDTLRGPGWIDRYAGDFFCEALR
ncbi:MAG: hypothetical protein RL756_2938 [Pseudomonadota bacterium]